MSVRAQKGKSYDDHEEIVRDDELRPNVNSHHVAVASYSSVGRMTGASQSESECPLQLTVDKPADKGATINEEVELSPLASPIQSEFEFDKTPSPMQQPMEFDKTTKITKSPRSKKEKRVPMMDYVALTVSAFSTWSFYNLFIAFWTVCTALN